MKENVDKQIETLVDKAMKHSIMERPSFDFTSKVMSQVERVNQNATISYQPLISKRIWALIVIGFLAFIAYILFVSKPETSAWFNKIDFRVLNGERLFNGFEHKKISQTFVYGFVLLALMLLIQIPVLKNYFDKRILS